MTQNGSGTVPAGELNGKVAVVTGGSRGLGREMIRAFAARGADVVIASRKIENCRELADEVSNEFGVSALPVRCNVSVWEECDDLVDAAYGHFDRVDILVNNAGLSPLYPDLESVSPELFDKVIGVNLRGPFRLMASIGSRMATGEGGSIINIGSVEAIRPRGLALPYAAAKAGLHVLSEGFAQSLGPKVRVNTIQAGAFLTDISENWPAGLREELVAATALARCAEANEIVGAAIFFATSASSFATGAVLRYDGGFR